MKIKHISMITHISKTTTIMNNKMIAIYTL